MASTKKALLYRPVSSSWKDLNSSSSVLTRTFSAIVLNARPRDRNSSGASSSRAVSSPSKLPCSKLATPSASRVSERSATENILLVVR